MCQEARQLQRTAQKRGPEELPLAKVRVSDRERQAGTAQELVERRGTPLRGWLRGATPRPGRGRRPRGATPHPRSGSCARAERSYPTFKVRSGHHDEIPLVQGKEQRLRFAGAAVKRYPMSKVRETQVRWQVLREGIRGQTD